MDTVARASQRVSGEVLRDGQDGEAAALSLYPDWSAKDNYARRKKTKIKKDNPEVVESKKNLELKTRLLEDLEG
jgi:hypothetical protein